MEMKQTMRNNNVSNKLYHYTSFDNFVKIWLTKKLKFGSTQNVNDLLEAEITAQANFGKGALIYAFHHIKSQFKQISLTMDYSSTLKGCMSAMMWGHYGDKRKGVCIELDFEKLTIPNDCYCKAVRYVKYVSNKFEINPKIKTQRQLKRSLLAHINRVFFTKEQSWRGENEFRIVSDLCDFLDIENAITAVYLTDYKSSECELVEKLVNEEVPVMSLCFRSGSNKKATPRLKATKEYREYVLAAQKDPKNVLIPITEQDKAHFEKNKYNLDADLTLNQYYLNKSDQKG